MFTPNITLPVATKSLYLCTTTTINTETLNLEDNIILLNSGTSGSPTENAGIQVDRGSSADVFLQYNETSFLYCGSIQCKHSIIWIDRCTTCAGHI